MLLHYAISKIKKQQVSHQDFNNLTNLNFDLKKPNSTEKFVYPVFGVNCHHLEVPIDLPDVIKGINSKEKQFICLTCKSRYSEIEQFWAHPIFSAAYEQFHPLIEKISILHGFLLCNLKRGDRRFRKPLCSPNIKDHIIQLLTNEKGQLLMEQNQNEFKFKAICLLDNVNIVIPVRHRDCRHISAYELTSLITYQFEKYEKSREGVPNKSLKCKHEQCQSLFPLQSIRALFEVLVLDFDFLKAIKMGYPGSCSYIGTLVNERFIICDQITNNVNKNRDNYIRYYWEQNSRIEFGLIADQFQRLGEANTNGIQTLQEFTTYEQFQKLVLEKMMAVIGQDRHCDVIEKLRIFNYGVYQVPLKDLCQRNSLPQIIEYPARCKNCPINDGEIKSIDVRTMIAYILHRQIICKASNNEHKMINCPLCGTQFTRTAATINFTNDLIYYHSELYFQIQKQNSFNADLIMQYDGRKQLFSIFQTEWCYTIQDFREQEVQVIYFKNSLLFPDPIVNFKCKNQERISFGSFYQKFKANNYKMTPGLKLCLCQGCELVDRIEGQLYYDRIFVEAQSQNLLKLECKYGFSYNIETQEIIELQPNNVYTKYIIPD